MSNALLATMPGVYIRYRRPFLFRTSRRCSDMQVALGSHATAPDGTKKEDVRSS